MQSLTTYFKRVILLALLAVLGYGIGTAFRPADFELQAKKVADCNENECVKAPHPQTGEEFGICSYELIEDKNCRNVKDTENCEYIPC